MEIIQLLASDSYIVVNKEIARLLGIEGAVLFGELCAEYNYWRSVDGLENGYFYSTIENIEKQTTLYVKKQRTLLNKMKEMNLIDVVIKGLPAKRFIKINVDVIEKLLTNKLGKNDPYSLDEMTKLDRSNEPTNNNNIKVINNIKKEDIPKGISKKESRFAPPTLEEVRDYCYERKNNIDPSKFIDFYESKGWMIGKNKMKDWKAAVRTWERRDPTPKDDLETRDPELYKRLKNGELPF